MQHSAMTNAFLRAVLKFVHERAQGAMQDRIAAATKIESFALARRIEQSGDAMAAMMEELAELRVRQDQIERLLSQAAEPEQLQERPALPVAPLRLMPGEAITAADYLSPLAGFYPVESDESGQLFRWTGPRHEFSFDLDLGLTGAVLFEMVLLGSFCPNQAESMGLQCEGAWLKRTFHTASDRTTIQFRLPDVPASGRVSLICVVAKVGSPASQDNSDDRRVLGVRFNELRRLAS